MEGDILNEFKPVKSEKIVISIRIDTDKLKTIDGLATATDISRNEMIIQCIDYAIKNIDKKNGL